MRFSVLLSGSILAAASLTVHAARAGDQVYPLSFVDRPLTLPAMTLAPEFDFTVDRVSLAVAGADLGAATAVGMNLGASFGITNDIEVGALVLPIQFNNGAGYGDPTIHGTFRFLNTPTFQMGARLDLGIGIPHDGLGGGVAIEPGVPMLFNAIPHRLTLLAEVAIPIAVAGSSPTGTGVGVGLNIPIEVAFDIIEPLHVDATTGLVIGDFLNSQVGPSTAIPLGFGAGYAIGDKRPIVDIDLDFQWKSFIVPGAPDGASKIQAGVFTLGLTAKGYFYF